MAERFEARLRLLGLQRIATPALERESKAYHLPRAVHFDGDVMRMVPTMGLTEKILPAARIHPGMRFVNLAPPPQTTIAAWNRRLQALEAIQGMADLKTRQKVKQYDYSG